MWTEITCLSLGIIIGAALMFFGFKKYLIKNPLVNEKQIREMFKQMGRTPSEKQIKQIVESMKKTK
ncbi:YneF family protein [Candidatus Phytoplasma prunorum]|uniref:YneF family protein n=1 Tax=Candidatus Phytoplasma prunorum TaxID=47565 RepID=UPI002FF32788